MYCSYRSIDLQNAEKTKTFGQTICMPINSINQSQALPSLSVQSFFLQVDRLVNVLKSIGQIVGTPIDSINQSQALPPASVQSFLKKHNISAVVITDHKEAFTNR